MFAVFTDTESLLDSFIRKDNHYWKGLGCGRDNDDQTDTTIEITCLGPARTVSVVTYGYTPYISADVQYAEVIFFQFHSF